MDSKYNYFAPSNKLYMVVIAILIVMLFIFGHIVVGVIALAFYAVLIVYNIKNVEVKKDEWKKFIEDFSSKLDIATRSTLVKLPFPLAITSKQGGVLWYNQNFISVLEGVEVLGKNINDLVKDMNINFILEGKKNLFKDVRFKEKYYDIYTSLVDTSDNKGGKDKIILFYFYDVTEMHGLITNLEDNKETAMLLEIDNLDEVLKSTEEDKKPLLVAEIERGINGYAQSISAMMKKYSSNKYILSVQDKYIKQEMDKKFDILDAVREINIGNKLAVTLSVGIGRGAKNPLENYKLAVSAKDLALGRGGDQVVIKSNEKLAFYGGKTKEVEKRTRVRARVISHALLDLINGSDKIFIMGHSNPDIDCLGAAIGIYSTIRLLKKECYIVLEGINNSIKPILAKFNEDVDYAKAFVDADWAKNNIKEESLLVIVDVNSRGYVNAPVLLNMAKKYVVIDHHRKSTDYIEGAVLSYVEPYASSTSELVTEMLQYMIEKPKIKQIEAEALLAGICIDTKNFSFKTGVRTFEAAGFLRRLGADTIDVKRLFADNLDVYLKRAEIIKSAKLENNIAIAVCPPNIEDSVLAAQAADELLNITGIQASFVLVKIEEDIFISGRSLGEINVQLILESLGGGGHMTMAGAKFSKIPMELAVDKLKTAMDKYLREGEKK